MSQFFNISVLSALWRVISGESLKIHDLKLKNLCEMVQTTIKEQGDPFMAIAQQFPTFQNILNQTGFCKRFGTMKELIGYCQENINLSKQKHIDGDNPLTFIEAMLHKIQTTNDVTNPLHGDLGELNLLSILMDLFFAGSDTTSTTLNWAMLFMVNYPDIQTKVREELLNTIGMSRTKLSDRLLTPYTEAVIHEIQRMGNIAPTAVFHQASKPLKIGMFDIPVNTIIVPMIGEVMHNPEQFPNPMEFKPERYLIVNVDGTMKFTPHPHIVPFGIGKRRCLGENLARTTLFKFFTTIIQKYEVVSGQKEQITETSICGAIRSPHPYKLKFVKLSTF